MVSPVVPATKPGKSLVLCCDGTWNLPDERIGQIRTPTNVTKVALGVADKDGDGRKQLLYYQRGVGTRQFQRLRGGGFGYGLSRNVRECYRFIVENYEPGDELYFFGFSRGAYTARSTVGLIRNSGILRPEHSDRLNEAYNLYRSRAKRAGPDEIASELFRRTYSHAPKPPYIHFIGVWDTVGSVGIPIDGVRVPLLLSKYWGFHDTKLSSYVLSAYHAVAIDERRRPFKPTLWRQADIDDTDVDVPDALDREPLEQVWFSGVHRDVGGGYTEPDLSEIPLLWMVHRARGRGLVFHPDHFVQHEEPGVDARPRGEHIAPDPLGERHNSLKGFYLLLGWRRRRINRGDGQSVASSAVRRLNEKPGYHPKSLEDWVAVDGDETVVADGSPPAPVACDQSE